MGRKPVGRRAMTPVERVQRFRKRRAKSLKVAEARAKFAGKQAKIVAKACAFPAGIRYPVILADPPWRFEPYSRETGMSRSADNHYGTMTVDEICALPVRELAADDAILYLWSTMPMLPAALRVIEAWGFLYRSGFSWHKDRIGTGYWVRGQHELLLIATRGKMPAPLPRSASPPSSNRLAAGTAPNRMRSMR